MELILQKAVHPSQKHTQCFLTSVLLCRWTNFVCISYMLYIRVYDSECVFCS